MLGDSTLLEFLAGRREAANHRPWPRFILDEQGWLDLIDQLSVRRWRLLGLWADVAEVHCALEDTAGNAIAVASLFVSNASYPSLSRVRPGAIRLERTIKDIYGLTAEGLTDQRPWLDHGRWGRTAPLGSHSDPTPDAPYAYPFLRVEGESLHQIPVGPVHAGVIEPGHFRFTCQGETVVRLEERLGYTHKGVQSLMAGKTALEAAKIAARLSGDSTVAYSIAFARAVEAALDAPPPPRADWIRALFAELERFSNHLADFGAVCNDAAFAFMLAECMSLREQILNLNLECFGHRLLMDRVIPGGVTCDVTPEMADKIRALMAKLFIPLKKLVNIYDDSPSLQDRTVTTGRVDASLAHRFGAGGYVGRASSNGGDARKAPGYPPYDRLEFETPVRPEGDVNARLWVRILEVRASAKLIVQILDLMPEGPIAKPVPARFGEGMAIVESFRGDIFMWVRLSEVGRIVRCHPRDPSWFQWPLLEAAIEGNIVADFPLINKSFNCSYSGSDL